MSSEYRFVVADTPELRRMPWEKMEAEGKAGMREKMGQAMAAFLECALSEVAKPK